MSGLPVRRFPFSQWVQYRVTDPYGFPGSSYMTALPGDELQDFLNIKSADPETFGKVTLANSISFLSSSGVRHITNEPYQKFAHLQSPALYSGDLAGATKIEIVSKFKFRQFPPLGSNYTTMEGINIEVDPYVMLRFFNDLSDPNWKGSFNDDSFLIDALGGRTFATMYVAPGAGFKEKFGIPETFFPTHVPCHGKVFSNGVSILGTDLTDGSEIAAVDAMKEYRLDITGKDYNFIQYLQGTINISQVSVKSTITQNMIVDLYGVWIEVTYASKPSHGSSLLSSAG